MRRKRSSGIAFILAIALVIGMFPAAVSAAPAPISVDAQNMANLGLLRGVDAERGVDAAFLAMETQRYQAVVIMARLMGREAELLATNPNAPSFPDAAGTSEFVRRTMAFAKANPELGFVGFPDGTFAPLEPVTAQQIYKVLLVASGFEEGSDFNWGQVFNFAQTQGMSQLAGLGVITNDHLATALMEGLRANTADGVNNLGNLLVTRGVISQQDAAIFGVFGGSGGAGGGMQSINAVGLGIMSAHAVGDPTTTTIRVRFNMPVHITARDVSITSGTGSATMGAVTNVRGADDTWDIAVSNVQAGTVTVNIGRHSRAVMLSAGAQNIATGVNLGVIGGATTPLTSGSALTTVAPTAAGNMTFGTITWTGTTPAAIATGDVPVATFTATALSGFQFADADWATGAAGTRLSVANAASVQITRNSATQLTITVTFNPVT